MDIFEGIAHASKGTRRQEENRPTALRESVMLYEYRYRGVDSIPDKIRLVGVIENDRRTLKRKLRVGTHLYSVDW